MKVFRKRKDTARQALKEKRRRDRDPFAHLLKSLFKHRENARVLSLLETNRHYQNLPAVHSSINTT